MAALLARTPAAGLPPSHHQPSASASALHRPAPHHGWGSDVERGAALHAPNSAAGTAAHASAHAGALARLRSASFDGRQVGSAALHPGEPQHGAGDDAFALEASPPAGTPSRPQAATAALGSQAWAHAACSGGGGHPATGSAAALSAHATAQPAATARHNGAVNGWGAHAAAAAAGIDGTATSAQLAGDDGTAAAASGGNLCHSHATHSHAHGTAHGSHGDALEPPLTQTHGRGGVVVDEGDHDGDQRSLNAPPGAPQVRQLSADEIGFDAGVGSGSGAASPAGTATAAAPSLSRQADVRSGASPGCKAQSRPHGAERTVTEAEASGGSPSAAPATRHDAPGPVASTLSGPVGSAAPARHDAPGPVGSTLAQPAASAGLSALRSQGRTSGKARGQHDELLGECSLQVRCTMADGPHFERPGRRFAVFRRAGACCVASPTLHVMRCSTVCIRLIVS